MNLDRRQHWKIIYVDPDTRVMAIFCPKGYKLTGVKFPANGTLLGRKQRWNVLDMGRLSNLNKNKAARMLKNGPEDDLVSSFTDTLVNGGPEPYDLAGYPNPFIYLVTWAGPQSLDKRKHG